MYINTFVTKLEEPCEGRLSSTVPWERRGEIPLRDPIVGKPHHYIKRKYILTKIDYLNTKIRKS